MADNDIPVHAYEPHQETYEGFITMTKWGVIACVVVLVLMAIFLL